MPRFYVPQALAVGALVDLPEPVVRHLQVLRLAPGALITLFNGTGGEYGAALKDLGKKHAVASVVDFTPRETELDYRITLAQALPEAAKMDWIIEKAVELGVSAVQPLAAQRCVVRLSAERASRKIAHWEGIIVAASEQCGRNRLTALGEPSDFSTWIARDPGSTRILLTPRSDLSLSAWAAGAAPQAVTLIVGPEGGLSDREEELARARGALALSMGPRILRTETAALAAVALLNGIWGQM